MKISGKTTNIREENRERQNTYLGNKKQLKFERVRKNSNLQPLILNQTCEQTNRKYIYDQQTMNQMIQSLKQQNNQLRNIIKVQQTQIKYFQDQQMQRKLIMTSNNSLNTQDQTDNKILSLKKLQTQYLAIKKQNQYLQQQNKKIKKTIKYTTIKQLQSINQIYIQQINNLTAKILSYQKTTTNIQQLNKIIQKQYLTSLKNRQLQLLIKQKIDNLQQSGKIVRKLKNLLVKKNKQIEQLKQQNQKNQKNAGKMKNMQEYVPKSQLINRKKQLLAMSQIIQNLQIKLTQCQTKTQILQQQNIDNINRQTSKRKQILSQYQKLLKKCQILQQNLTSKRKNDSLLLLKLDKNQQNNQSIRKIRNPLIVKFQDIKQSIEIIVYNLQSHGITYNNAPLLFVSKKQKLKLKHGTIQHNDIIMNIQETEQIEKISLAQIIECLQQNPINLQKSQYRELVARYLVQDGSQIDQYINFQTLANLHCVRSIFKKIIQNYPIFSSHQIHQNCLIVQDYLKRNQCILKITVSKLSFEQDKDSLPNLNNELKQRKKGTYRGRQYVEAILKQNQLTQTVYNFLKFWTFRERNIFLTYQEFQQSFKVQGVCTFITQDPQSNFC